MSKPRQWNVHLDTKWTGCKQEYDEPNRLYLNLGSLGQVIVGLPSHHDLAFHNRDGVEVVERVARWHWVRAQVWTWRHGCTERFAIVTFHLGRRWLCKVPIGRDSTCGAARWHRGPHRQPFSVEL